MPTSTQTPMQAQVMTSTSTPKKPVAIPRPSASIMVISPSNQVLLLHRVKTSSSFPSAHVFPGGNLCPKQDGGIPPPDSAERHMDGRAYRVGATRECFEESGILLARSRDQDGELLDIEEEVREKGRSDIHAGRARFEEWVQERGGIVDTDSLIPFTRWITPTNIPKRFTTQMYIYFLPLTRTASRSTLPAQELVQVPTSDGGKEHTTAQFASCKTWLDQASRNEIILFPPQFYLMHLLTPFLNVQDEGSLPNEELQKQRDQVMEFLNKNAGDGIKWAEKVICPMGLCIGKSDGKSVLALDKPGPELSDSGRAGDTERVVLVNFRKEGPRYLEIRDRYEVLSEERRPLKV